MATQRGPALIRFFHPGRVLALAASTAAASLTVSAASASLLGEPPRLCTFKLDDPASPKLGLLRAFYNAEIERPGPLRRYLGGAFGQWRQKPWWTLAWKPFSAQQTSSGELDGQEHSLQSEAAPLRRVHIGWAVTTEPLFGFEAPDPLQLDLDPELRLASLLQLAAPSAPSLLASTGPSFASDGFDSLWAKPPVKPIRDWRCRRKPVAFSRYGGESQTFALVRCDGSVAPEALDRLSLMARPPEVPSQGDLLPDEPDPDAWQQGEWLPGVRLVHPRLLWLLQRIADAFPYRPIYIFSGYRPHSVVTRAGSHTSLHAEARAMDIHVYNVPNTTLFELCRTLDDVGCGFYPNSKFVHVDVRRPGTGHPFWIDISSPGEPSRYVDSWPGVVDAGAAIWDARYRTQKTQ